MARLQHSPEVTTTRLWGRKFTPVDHAAAAMVEARLAKRCPNNHLMKIAETVCSECPPQRET